ncbi:DUF5615 family PIN-like protein [uncultured Alsobacter sp.]|uniref:DUF5615 family PIN-like protein n=1 Tax=uncultured Alsobacter sp. TaxID=1748258 RepID=UPI0025DF403A|nr:DUF5615 family PIN-like protein [uncultured Alsobacter sp.]
MFDRLFIDECLSSGLVAVAKTRGFVAEYGPYVGKRGWQDWSIVQFAIDNSYVVITNTRRDFLRHYARLPLHNGLIVLVPNIGRADQIRLFNLALDALTATDGGLVNRVVEVTVAGAVFAREWSRDRHDLGHIEQPDWHT